ncbi:MAG: hypothetical protein OQJ97_16680 [Rhodospirillales bacterium]|nr:hypothetical protein [Rhodospirillales bacterium]
MSTSEHEIIRSASILVQQHGRYDALNFSARKIAELKEHGDMLGVMVWERICSTIQDKPPLISP